MSQTTPDDIQEVLGQHFLFSALSTEQIEALADQVWIEEIPSGSVIVREGDEADALYVVVKGGVNVVKGDDQFLSFLGPGGFFGEMALFTEGSRRSATCLSTTDTTCVILRKHVLDNFCELLPRAGLKIYRAIIQTLAERLQTTSADLAYLMGAQVRRQTEISKMVQAAKDKE